MEIIQNLNIDHKSELFHLILIWKRYKRFLFWSWVLQILFQVHLQWNSRGQHSLDPPDPLTFDTCDGRGGALCGSTPTSALPSPITSGGTKRAAPPSPSPTSLSPHQFSSHSTPTPRTPGRNDYIISEPTTRYRHLEMISLNQENYNCP